MNKKVSQSDLLVVLGTDAEKKPHAAAFSAADEAIVHKAASLMSMRVGRATGDKARALARKLPEGKLFATGKALVPLVRRPIFDDLADLLEFADIPANNNGAKEAAGASSDANQPHGQNKQPAHDLWTDIKVGSVVLCRDDGDEPGWWESVVMAIGPDNESMTMRWRDYPDLKSFPAKRHAVGLLGPKAPGKPARR
jgi:hypothetical protein